MKLRELFNREVPLCFTVIYYFENARIVVPNTGV